EKGRGVDVAEEAEPRDDAGEGLRLRQDVDELDLEQIARPGAPHEHGSGQRVDGPRVHLGYAIRGDRWPEQLDIAAVTRLEHHLFALSDLEDRRNVGVPAIVSGLGLVDQTLAAINLDALHWISLVLRICVVVFIHSCAARRVGRTTTPSSVFFNR